MSADTWVIARFTVLMALLATTLVLPPAIAIGWLLARREFPGKALLETKGIGPWSAEYISLRAIGDGDAFPKTDLILKRVLALHPDLDVEAIRPWRSYAAMYLWKEYAQTLSKSRRLHPGA